MEGSVYDIAVFASTLYIGGDFKKINEENKKHTFMLQVKPDALKSEEDVRKVLRFDAM